MTSPIEIVKVLQQIPPMSTKIRFFVSLADYAFRYGGLTKNQELAYNKAVEELHKEGVWNETAN